MVLASGLNFGAFRSVPLIVGIAAGFSLMVFIVGLGLGTLTTILPKMDIFLRIFGSAYMLWMAWGIAVSKNASGSQPTGEPVRFLQAAAFQWINPKAWIMAITANSSYGIINEPFLSALIVSGAFAFVSFPSNATWLLLGTWLRSVLKNARTLRMINISIAIFLAASVLPILWTINK